MGTRKITRKEMKQDEFVSTVGRITMWVEEHLIALLWGAAAVLAVVALGYAVISWRTNRAMEAHGALSVVVETYGSPVGSAVPENPGQATFTTEEDKFRTVMALADGVIQNHGSTDAGQIARLYRGLAAFELDENEEARADLEAFLAANPSHFLAPQVRRKLAEMDELAGNLDQACEAFRQLSQQASPVLPEELSLLDLARCLAANGEREESTATYQRILDDFPGSVYVSEARTSLQKLEEG
jgi:tetratricopeptide (TPR) repeat protein